MQFCTKEDCEEWLRKNNRQKPDKIQNQAYRLDHPTADYRVFFLANSIATVLTAGKPVLLWVTEWGIWPSSENWDLYYRIRKSYGDSQLLHEAPGHLFLEHESSDLASFLQLAILNGWGGYVLSQADHINAFFSHDEYIDFFASNDATLDQIRKML